MNEPMYPDLPSGADESLDEEAEALERYPWLAQSSVDSSSCVPSVDSDIKSSGKELATENTEHADEIQDSGVDYADWIDDSELPKLDFRRWDNVFAAKTGNGWLADPKTQTPQRPLFGSFWNEGELSILFADTGKGKSLLAVQIGQSIASGMPFGPFELGLPAQRVAYFDFELTERQFNTRYGGMPFCDYFVRAAPRNFEELPPEYQSYGTFLADSVVRFIDFIGAKVVIIDNITWMSASTENAAAALRLMKSLKLLQVVEGISILVLAHTPKRAASSPLTLNDLQGSRMLANFADGIFALGSDYYKKDIRYLKQLKVRSTALEYDTSRVCTLRLQKLRALSEPGAAATGSTSSPHNSSASESRFTNCNSQKNTCGNFLGFEFIGCSRERDHLRFIGCETEAERKSLLREAERIETAARIQRSQLIRKAVDLAAAGLTQRQIADELGVSAATVNRYLRAASRQNWKR